MKIQTSRFGDIDVTEDSFVIFPSGLVGLPQYSRYVIFEEEQGSGYQWLQSVDEPTLAFVIVQADLVNPDWQIQVPDDTVAELEIHEDDPTSILVIVTIPQGKPEHATVNLRGPVIVNLRNRKAKQVILHESVPLRFSLCGKEESMTDELGDSMHVVTT